MQLHGCIVRQIEDKLSVVKLSALIRICIYVATYTFIINLYTYLPSAMKPLGNNRFEGSSGYLRLLAAAYRTQLTVLLDAQSRYPFIIR